VKVSIYFWKVIGVCGLSDAKSASSILMYANLILVLFFKFIYTRTYIFLRD
jgi:hypothetical protein